jgi:hypothetical protein
MKKMKFKTLRLIGSILAEHTPHYPAPVDVDRLKVDEGYRLQSIILGKDFVPYSIIPPKVLAAVLYHSFYHAHTACLSSRDGKNQTVDFELLNSKSWNRVTPLAKVVFPKGLKPSSKLFLMVDTEPTKGDGIIHGGRKSARKQNGSYFILTDGGVYHWNYSYQRTSSKKAFRSVCAEFSLVTPDYLEAMIVRNPKMPLEVIFRLKEQINYRIVEASRTKNRFEELHEKITSMIVKINR